MAEHERPRIYDAYGEQRHVIEHELHARIDDLARAACIDPAELMAATEQLVQN